MLKKLVLAASVAISCFTAAFVATSLVPVATQGRVADMPVLPAPQLAHLVSSAPIEQRGAEFRRWLAVSLKIKVSSGSGSGTIVYFDPASKYAYVQSCGHLWSGNMSAEEGSRRNLKCSVVTWYHNSAKLDREREYDADVIYYSNTRGHDCSLVRFKPDWVPGYFPIGPADIKLPEDSALHSLGCDGGREVAHYTVKVVGPRFGDLITNENSPRPGRSGGGLMTDEYFVGVCWGTSVTSGEGIGYFTPLKTVRDLNERNGYGWLNNVGVRWANQIPIVDRNGPQGKYPKDYIPFPDR